MKNLLKRFMKEESGATMVEYAIMVALIAVAAIAVVTLIGGQVTQVFDDVAGALPVSAGGETTPTTP